MSSAPSRKGAFERDPERSTRMVTGRPQSMKTLRSATGAEVGEDATRARARSIAEAFAYAKASMSASGVWSGAESLAFPSAPTRRRIVFIRLRVTSISVPLMNREKLLDDAVMSVPHALK